ncbi:hypothetical protein EDD85DRAFT_758743, partial [Armillaria nabsnona]
DLIQYFKYASSGYTPFCPRPNGRTLVTEVHGFLLNIDGLRILRNCGPSFLHILVNSDIVLVPLITPGVSSKRVFLVFGEDSALCKVVMCVQLAVLFPKAQSRACRWNSIAVEIIQQSSLHPDLKNIVKISHSLRGSLETLTAICLPSLDVFLRRT